MIKLLLNKDNSQIPFKLITYLKYIKQFTLCTLDMSTYLRMVKVEKRDVIKTCSYVSHIILRDYSGIEFSLWATF